MKKRIMIIGFILVFLFLIGCGGYSKQDYMLDDEEEYQQEIMNSTQLANPATLHCMNTSGSKWTEVIDEELGSYGLCTFIDGSSCEEWAYYREECLPGSDMISCEGKFWGKSVCAPTYEPVCGVLGEIDISTEEVRITDEKNFNNACSACTYSKESLVVLGYNLGKC